MWFQVVLLIGFLILTHICVKLTFRWCKSYTCLVGKTAIITGGNEGTGYKVALGLAARGCRVILACRRDVETIRQQIIEESNNQNVIYKRLDLLSFNSIRKFAKEINETEKRLDILINNADMDLTKENRHTPDGLHPHMQANYFGNFLLTHLLADLLKKSSPSRIVFVSSFRALFNNLSIENLNPPKDSLGSYRLYNNSRAAILIMANMFAEKLRIYRVTSNTANPGLIRSNMIYEIFNDIRGSDENFFYNMFKRISRFVLYFYSKDIDDGAQPILKLALDRDFETATGHFIWDFYWHPLPSCTKNREFCRQIWEESERLTKLQPVEKLF